MSTPSRQSDAQPLSPDGGVGAWRDVGDWADALAVMVWVADPEGRATYVNRRWRDYTGSTLQELHQNGWQWFHPPEDIPALEALWGAAIARGDAEISVEYRYRRHDGEYRWMQGRTTAQRDALGRVVRWVGTVIDVDDLRLAERSAELARGAAERARHVAEVERERAEAERARAETERERAEAERERAEAERRLASDAASSKDRFLAVLSHELRTPLTPVLAASQMIEHDPRLPDDLRDAAALVSRNVELEARIIDDLLDLTRISRCRLDLHLRPVDLHDQVRQVAEVCGPEMSSKGIHVSLHLASAAPRLEADPARIHQVVWNLFKNANKFTPVGGRVDVRTFDLAEDIVLEIHDNGVGIEPERLLRIFEGFEPESGRRTRQFGGLGLGLAISRALTEMHGGTLTADSPGRGFGSTFRLTLPRRPQAVVAAPLPRDPDPTAPDPSERPRYKLLLVEDSPDTLRVLARLLTLDGHDVRTADCVATALRLASAEPFDLLVSDIGLPDGSGVELMRQVKRRHNLRGIALSGFGMDSDIRASLDAGFDAHLTKPVMVSQLRNTIRDVLTRT